MEKIWVKVNVSTIYNTSTDFVWKKGKLISKDLDNDTYKVRYEDSGMKEFIFSKDLISMVKPEELKVNREEYLKRGMIYKFIMIFVLFVAVFTGFHFIDMKTINPFFPTTIVFSMWILLFVSIDIIDRIMKAEIRQEEIHKMLKDKE